MKSARCVALVLAGVILIAGLVWSVTAQQTINDFWQQAWQTCGSTPCLNVKTVASSGKWTGPGTLNDLFFLAFGTCGGQPCLTVNTSSGGLTVLSATRPNQALTNSAIGDADFTSVYTIPASTLIPNRTLRVVFHFKLTTGGTASTENYYLKLGGTKAFGGVLAMIPGNNETSFFDFVLYIWGTANPAASVPVEVGTASGQPNSGQRNIIAPPNLATNSTLTLGPGVTWGSNTNADTLTLLNAMVEQLN